MKEVLLKRCREEFYNYIEKNMLSGHNEIEFEVKIGNGYVDFKAGVFCYYNGLTHELAAIEVIDVTVWDKDAEEVFTITKQELENKLNS